MTTTYGMTSISLIEIKWLKGLLLFINVIQKSIQGIPRATSSKRRGLPISVCIFQEELVPRELIVGFTTESHRRKILIRQTKIT